MSASDLSQAMASEAARRYKAELAGGAQAPQQAPQFEASDLESLAGRWDLVACLDVLIHYDKACSCSCACNWSCCGLNTACAEPCIVWSLMCSLGPSLCVSMGVTQLKHAD